MDLEETLQHYIRHELLNGQHDLTTDDNLLTDGMVDSIGMVRLIGFIEENFGVEIPPEDFTIENFETIKIITSYLRERMDSETFGG